jgi:hypothetical protein
VAIKGVSLPVNTAVIVIVALIVLVSIVFYLIIFRPQTGCGSLVELGCARLHQEGCSNEDYVWTLSVGCPPDQSNGQCGCSLDEVRSQAGMSKEEFLRYCGCLK